MPSAFSRLHSKVFCTTEYLLAHGFLNTVLSFLKSNHYTLLILQKTPNDERKRLLFLKTHTNYKKNKVVQFHDDDRQDLLHIFLSKQNLESLKQFCSRSLFRIQLMPPLVCCTIDYLITVQHQ